MFKKKILLPLLVILALSLTACANDEENIDIETETPPVEEEKTEDTPDTDLPNKDVDTNEEDIDITTEGVENYEDIKLRPEEAFDIYMDKYPDTKVKEIELDTEDDLYVYQVKGYDNKKEYKVYIHPIDGSIIKEKEEKEDDSNKEISRENVEKIKALVDKTLEEAGKDVILDEWSLEIEDEIAELEVEVDFKNADDIEYKYDVETGELLEKDD